MTTNKVTIKRLTFLASLYFLIILWWVVFLDIASRNNDSFPVGHSVSKGAANVVYCIEDELIETEMYLAESW